MTTERMDNWYWGALRAACGDLNWPRAWQLIVAWPSSPDLTSSAEAQDYLLRSAMEKGATDEALDWFWVRDHYRSQPVAAYDRDDPVFLQHTPLTAGCSREGLNRSVFPLNWEFHAPELFGPVLSLRTQGMDKLTFIFTGYDRKPFHHHPSQYVTYSAAAAIKVADLLARAGHAIKSAVTTAALHAEGRPPRVRCDLTWCRDIQERMRADGPDAHPNLRFGAVRPDEAGPGLTESLQKDPKSGILQEFWTPPERRRVLTWNPDVR